MHKPLIFINSSKCLVNFEKQPFLFCEFVKKIISQNYLLGVVSIYGPSFAQEVYDRKEMDLNIASDTQAIAEQVFFLFNNKFFSYPHHK